MILEKAPNREYLEFSFVGDNATGKGLNQKFIMEAMPEEGCFKCTEGRIGIRVGPHKPKSWTCPMDDWDMVYSIRIAKGWQLISTKRETKKITRKGFGLNGVIYRQIEEKETADVVQRLLEAASQLIEESYTTRIENISPEMMAHGKEILDKLAAGENLSVAAFNNLLKQLFCVIPRRIDNLSKVLAKRPLDYGPIVEREQDLYEILCDQLKMTNSTASGLQTVTEAYGLEWRLATPEEKNYVLGLMNEKNRIQVINIWRIKNKKTEARFNQWCSKHGYYEGYGISHLFHGSPMANWWSIVTNGLWIRPGLNGGMFGAGLYFAPESDKSMGYTGYGCWRNKGEARGFLSLNKVATGKPFYYYRDNGTSQDMSLMGMQRRGTDCLWAESYRELPNSPLRRDEVIIYDDSQTTIEYLIETTSEGY